MKANEVMQRYNIHRTTLCRWVKKGKIAFSVLPSGRYEYIDKYQLPDVQRKNIIYARVSSTTQKDNLPRQIERLQLFASSKGIVVDDVYSEVASALNYERKKYRKLFKDVVAKKIDNILIEYKDRLLRIGFEDFKLLCQIYGTKIIIVDNSNTDKSKQQEITDDLISIVHHFSCKIYSSRRKKKIINAIQETYQ